MQQLTERPADRIPQQQERGQVELDRLNELLSYAQLDTAADPDLDAITALASTLCGSSGSMINLLDNDRQWSKSLFGVDQHWKELQRSDSLCTHTIEHKGFFEIGDLSRDIRFQKHPLANNDSGIKHYAGVPLITAGGMALGAICVVSDCPRQLTEQQILSLTQLSQLAMTILDAKNPVNRVASNVAQKNHGVLYIEPDSAEILYCNRRIAELTGHDQLELASQPALSLCNDWTRDFMASLNIGEVTESLNTPASFELQNRNGAPVKVSVRWSLLNHYGSPLLVAVVEDRSKEAAHEKASKERNLFFDLSKDLILVCNSDGTVRDINPSFTQVLGYELAELKGKPPLGLIHPEDQPATLRDMENLTHGAVRAGLINRVRDSHGNYRWLSWNSVMSSEGLIYCSAQDITETREHTRKLTLLQRAIDCSQNAIIVANLEQPGGVVEYVNDAFEKTTGYASTDVIGRNCGFLQGKDKNQPGIQSIRNALKTKTEVHTLLRNYRKDGSMFWNELYLSPVINDDDSITHYVGVQYDVTELVNQRDQIVRLNRIESLRSAFNSTVSFGSSTVSLGSELCEVAVSVGQYPLVWIAEVDQRTGSLTIESAYGAFAHRLAEGTPLADLPCGWLLPYLEPALTDQEPIIFQQLDNAGLPQETAYRLRQEGFNSVAAFPISKNTKTTKIACFYSSEVNSFDTKEQSVIGNLLDDYGVAEKLANSTEELQRIAHRDDITGLPNHRLLAKLVSDQMPHATAPQYHEGAFITVVVERLIEIIGQIGRVKGRLLVQQLAEQLQGITPANSILSHGELGHFCLFLTNFQDKNDIVSFVETELLPVFEQPLTLSDDQELYVSGRVGIAMLSEEVTDYETLIDHSQVAALSGASWDQRYQFYTDSLTESARRLIQEEASLREAIRDQQFELHYQPKVNLRTNRIESFEGLLRWNHPERGLVSPGEFIPLLEETGLISTLTGWLLQQAQQAALAFNKQSQTPVRVAVNLSQIQLQHPDFMHEVDDFLENAGIPPETNYIDLELTESLLASNIDETSSTLAALQQRGFHIAIDDFGTGFSSLSYLARLPFDSLKIDLSFIRRMTASVEDMSIVSTIIGLSKSLDKKVIAEGVETREQANLLRLINCTEAQGYLVSRPQPQAAMASWVTEKEVIQFSAAP